MQNHLSKATKPSRSAHFWQGAESRAPATWNDASTSKSGANMRWFVHVDFKTCFAPQRRALFRHLNFQKRSDIEVFCTFWFWNWLRATTACTVSTSQLPPNPSVFDTFDFDLSCAPQRPTLFRHLYFQKWSEHGVLCAFWLGHVLRATTACNFSSLIWPDGSAPAALASLLFDRPKPQIIAKTQWIATFLSRMHSKTRVPVSLWGSGGWGCVRSTLPITVRNRPQPSATIRNRSQPFARSPYGRAYGKFCRRGHLIFVGFKRCVAAFRVAGVSLHDIHTTLNYIQLHYTTLHYTTLHYIPLRYTRITTTTILHVHDAKLHYTNYTTLHSTTLHYTERHCTTPTATTTTTSATATATTLHYIT